MSDTPQAQSVNPSPDEIQKRPWGKALLEYIATCQLVQEIQREAAEGPITPAFDQKMRKANIDLMRKFDAFSMVLGQNINREDALWPFAIHVANEGLMGFYALVGTMMAQRAAIRSESEAHQYEYALVETYRLLDKALGK